MSVNGCVAMVLAGGRGERLGALTHYYSKPAIHFGGKCRIIDFTLNNCLDSGIGTIGILSQYLSDDLHAYITRGGKTENSSIFMLPPEGNDDFYRGTADAVYKNIEFIEWFDPEDVLVVSGSHIYNMDYNGMLAFHRETGASVTVASTPVQIDEAPSFGIINAEKNGRMYGFEDKSPKSEIGLTSMGVYIFKWSILKRYLIVDNVSILTWHDLGGDILPKMLREGQPAYTYQFDGYWRDIETIDNLWEANMDQISYPPAPHVSDMHCYVAREAVLRNSIVSEGCSILGRVEHSVLCDQVTVSRGAEIVDSVVMPGAYIGQGARVYKTVVGTNAIIMDNAVIGAEVGSDLFIDRKVCTKGISLVAPWLYIKEGMNFKAGSHICEGRLLERAGSQNGSAEPYHAPFEGIRHEYAAYQALSV